MNTFRLVLLVLVTYALGLGTGAVAGVVLSFKELSRPVAATAPATPTSASNLLAGRTQTPPPVAMSTPTPAVQTPTTPSSQPPEPPVDTPQPVDTGEPPVPSETPKAEKPSRATLKVVANKGEGFVTIIDGQNAGETPVEVQVLPNKKHKIQVKGGDKFESWAGIVSIHAGQTRTVTARLTTRTPSPTPVSSSGGGYSSGYHGASHSSGGGGYGPPSVQGTKRF